MNSDRPEKRDVLMAREKVKSRRARGRKTRKFEGLFRRATGVRKERKGSQRRGRVRQGEQKESLEQKEGKKRKERWDSGWPRASGKTRRKEEKSPDLHFASCGIAAHWLRHPFSPSSHPDCPEEWFVSADT